MEVSFRRTGERRYAVVARPERWPAVTMDPAVGFDPLLPHDLAHYAVERELGIRHGLYGQLALGGDLRTFRRLDGTPDRRLRRRGARLLEIHSAEIGRSEHITEAATRAWSGSGPIDPALASLRAHLQQLSARWRALRIGGELILHWPEPTGSHALHAASTPHRRGAHRRHGRRACR